MKVSRHAMAIAALSVSACSFPDVQFSPADEGGSLSDANAGDATPDARHDGPDPLADAGGDGGKKDAAFDPCDVDGDGFAAKGACGGQDCDDHDARRNPGVNTYLTFPTADGDWNCNTIVEKQFSPNVNCGGILGQAQCNAAAGFSGDPACGASSSTYVTCVWNVVAVPPLCNVNATTSQTQGCQ